MDEDHGDAHIPEPATPIGLARLDVGEVGLRGQALARVGDADDEGDVAGQELRIGSGRRDHRIAARDPENPDRVAVLDGHFRYGSPGEGRVGLDAP